MRAGEFGRFASRAGRAECDTAQGDMAKRKKKILFDVFGGTPSHYGDERNPGREVGGGRRRSDELRLTRSFATVLGLVLVAFVGLSYYLGTIHGTQSAKQEALPRLNLSNSSTGLSGPGAETSGRRFSVMARSLEYTRFSKQETLKHLRECKSFLLDQGLKPVEIFANAEKKDGSGRYNLWVGSASSKDGLASVVEKLRGLSFQKKQVFKLAVALEAPLEK